MAIAKYGTTERRTGALPDDESVAALVPGAGGGGRVPVAFAEGLAGDEAADAAGDDGRLRAPRQHQVRVPPLYMLCRAVRGAETRSSSPAPSQNSVLT